MGSTDMKTPQYGEVLAPTEGRILEIVMQTMIQGVGKIKKYAFAV